MSGESGCCVEIALLASMMRWKSSPKLGWLWTVIAVGYFESEPGILVLEKVEGSCFSSVESVSVIQNPETQPLAVFRSLEKLEEKVTSDTVAQYSTFRLFVVNIVLP